MTKKEIISAIRASRACYGMRKYRAGDWLIWAEKQYKSKIHMTPGPAWKWYYYAKRDNHKYKVGGWEYQNDAAFQIMQIEKRENENI